MGWSKKISAPFELLLVWVSKASLRRFFLSIFIPLVIIYGLTASWQLPVNGDALTNAITAWHIGNKGTVYLTGYGHLTEKPFHGPFGYYVSTPKGTVSQYPPGAALLAVPVYMLAHGRLHEAVLLNPSRPEIEAVAVSLPPLWPATVTAVLATAAAIAFLGLVFRGQSQPREAWIAAWVVGLGTSAWSVASDALWQHGPAMFWIALGLLLSSRKNYWASGLALGGAVLTRPHTAFVCACLGIACGVSNRSIRPVISIGVGSALGLLFLLVYNALIFSEVSISGGYGDSFQNRLVSFDFLFLFLNILGGLLDPRVGFLIWSPFLILLLPGLPVAWKNSGPWARGAAVGGLIYLLLQYKMNRYLPEFIPYRYPLEALVASAPLWFAAYLYHIKNSNNRIKRIFIYLLASGVVLHFVAALAG
ncbi:hypothetical protein [Halochromatium salexigens]|uniref:hypothetical protein n=1 Tax=Halochromatium salexigens TaxID=49447 RepID=UPI001914B4DF|nr:hypothetical protein [Halochromatium salexigens]